MNIQTMLENKQQQLRNVEHREAFLRNQLEECVQARLQLIGQISAVREVLEGMAAEQAAAVKPPRVPRGTPDKPDQLEVVNNGRDDT